MYGDVTNSQFDQLPVGLIVQLVEHCTGIAEVTGSDLVQAGRIFSCLISQLRKLCWATAMTNHVFIEIISHGVRGLPSSAELAHVEPRFLCRCFRYPL